MLRAAAERKNMKNIFRAAASLALCIVTLLSCGCEAIMPGGTASPIDTADLSGTDAGTVDTDGTSDPEYDSNGFAVFPEGNYLADPKFDTDEFLPDYDADLSFMQPFSTVRSSQGTVCTTDDTVYVYDPKNYRILYVDKATGIWGPLCGKPECTHTSSSCNAYISSPDALRVYDGMLYWCGWRMKLDGTDRERGTWNNNLDKIHNNPEAVIHRGYVYTAGGDHMYTSVGAKSRAVINVTAMDGSESFNLLTKPLPGEGASCMIRPVGNDLYIEIFSFFFADESDTDSEFYTVAEFYRWSSKTRKAELLFTIDGSDAAAISISSEAQAFLPVPGDGIYFSGLKRKDGRVFPGAFKYSFETGEITELFSHANRNEDETEAYNIYTRWTKEHFVVNMNTFTLGEDGKATGCVSSFEIFDLEGKSAGVIMPTTDTVGDLLGMDDDFLYYASGDQIALLPLDGGETLLVGGAPET